MTRTISQIGAKAELKDIRPTSEGIRRFNQVFSRASRSFELCCYMLNLGIALAIALRLALALALALPNPLQHRLLTTLPTRDVFYCS